MNSDRRFGLRWVEMSISCTSERNFALGLTLLFFECLTTKLSGKYFNIRHFPIACVCAIALLIYFLIESFCNLRLAVYRRITNCEDVPAFMY